MAGAFLQWRGCKATAMLGQNWRSYGGFGAARGEGERMRWSMRVRRAGAGLLLELERVTWRLQQSMRATRRAAPAPVGHGEL